MFKKSMDHGTDHVCAGSGRYSLLVFLILASCLMMSGSGVWKMEFSNAVTHYSSIFPERTGDYILQLLPENLYQQMTFRTAFVHTVVLLSLYFFLLSMILLFTSLCNRKFTDVLLMAY